MAECYWECRGAARANERVITELGQGGSRQVINHLQIYEEY